MSAVPASATPVQISTIKALLARAGFDRGTVSRKYRRLGVADSWIGRDVQNWLASLRFPEAERAIAQLKLDATHGAEAGEHTAARQASRA